MKARALVGMVLALGLAACAESKPAPVVVHPDPHAELAAIGDTIHFAAGSVAINSAAEPILERQSEWLRQNPDLVVTIMGYADEKGSAHHNTSLAGQRAGAVYEWLVKHGVAADRMAVASAGNQDPVCSERTDPCRNRNRRVVTLLK